MSLTLSGSGTVTGLTAGGLPDATVTSADIANANVTQAKLAAGVAGNGPAFSALPSTPQTVSSGTWTKLQFQTELFDTANCFDSVTNHRFTPNVAGYYQVNAMAYFSVTSSWTFSQIYRNGAGYQYGTNTNSTPNGSNSIFSHLIYLNGTSDYLEFYGYQASGSNTTLTVSSYFQASLVRAA